MAAHLAVGAGSAIAGMSAADGWKISRRPAKRTELVAPRRHRGLPGIVVHESNTLINADITHRNRIPITTVPRTLVDLADAMDEFQLTYVIHQADFRNRFNLATTCRAMDRNRHRSGHAIIKRAVEMHLNGSVGTRSDLEDLFLSLIRAAGFEMPIVNTHIPVPGGSIEVDFHWPHHRLCIEVDGSGHQRPRTRRQDAERDERLQAAGYEVLRIPAVLIETNVPEMLRQIDRAMLRIL